MVTNIATGFGGIFGIPDVGDWVLVDYHDRKLRTDGFIVKRLTGAGIAGAISDILEYKEEQIRQKFDTGVAFVADLFAPSRSTEKLPPNLNEAHPAFRPIIEEMITKLTEMGFQPELNEVFRTSERQQFLKDTGKSQTLESKHLNQSDGEPASLAVDIIDGRIFNGEKVGWGAA